MMLKNAYVPEDFGIGIIIPVIKDPRSDVSAVDNYGPITLSPIVSAVWIAIVRFILGKVVVWRLTILVQQAGTFYLESIPKLMIFWHVVCG